MKAEALGKITDGAVLQNARPYMEPLIQKRTQHAILEAMRLIQKHELTPEIAQMLWLKVWATEQLRRDVDTHIRVGQSAGETNAGAMELTKGDTNGA